VAVPLTAGAPFDGIKPYVSSLLTRYYWKNVYLITQNPSRCIQAANERIPGA
jgi:hypothetical protein